MAIEFESADMGPAWGVGGWGWGDTPHSAQPHARRDMHLACALRRLARSGLRPISPDMAGTARYNIVKLYIARGASRGSGAVSPASAPWPPARSAHSDSRARCEHVSRTAKVYTLYGYAPYP